MRDPIPPALWAVDHWSTFVYLGCVVHGVKGTYDDAPGVPILDKMRSKPGAGTLMQRLIGGRYPTKLKDGTELNDHDDHDCADDAIAAGLLTRQRTQVRGADNRHRLCHVYSLTEAGERVWAYLRGCGKYQSAGAMAAITLEEIARETGWSPEAASC
jgi:hypothetical protein